jgi:hypothetical protein
MTAKVRRVMRSVMPAFLLFMLAGCGIHKPFVPLTQLDLRPATLAVICGWGDDASMHLAAYLSDELTARTRLKVVGQEKIGRKLGKYPVNLKRVDAFKEKQPVWLAPDDKKKLDSLQAALRADYLFVVWAHGLSSSASNGYVEYSVTVLGNLYEYPGGRAVAFTYDENSKGMSPLAVFREQGHDINAMLKDSAEKVAEGFLKATHAAK